MKKLFAVLALSFAMILPALAQESESKEKTTPVWDHGDNKSPLTYQNVRFYRIYDQKDAYVVLYEKQGVKIGTAVLPKKWISNKEGPRKLIFREAPKGLAPYMTIIKNEGEFSKVWVTVPSNRFNNVWGIAPYGMKVEGTDADTLEIEY